MFAQSNPAHQHRRRENAWGSVTEITLESCSEATGVVHASQEPHRVKHRHRELDRSKVSGAIPQRLVTCGARSPDAADS